MTLLHRLSWSVADNLHWLADRFEDLGAWAHRRTIRER